MKDCQHNHQTNWINKYASWVDNTSDMKDFDLKPGNVDMEMADQFSEWGQYEEIEEE
jgi:hypothetical protein